MAKNITLNTLATAERRLVKLAGKYANNDDRVVDARRIRDEVLVKVGDGVSYAALAESMNLGTPAAARRRYLNATGDLTPKNPRS
jgi:hypothetical protein